MNVACVTTRIPNPISRYVHGIVNLHDGMEPLKSAWSEERPYIIVLWVKTRYAEPKWHSTLHSARTWSQSKSWSGLQQETDNSSLQHNIENHAFGVMAPCFSRWEDCWTKRKYSFETGSNKLSLLSPLNLTNPIESCRRQCWFQQVYRQGFSLDSWQVLTGIEIL